MSVFFMEVSQLWVLKRSGAHQGSMLGSHEVVSNKKMYIGEKQRRKIHTYLRNLTLQKIFNKKFYALRKYPRIIFKINILSKHRITR